MMASIERGLDKDELYQRGWVTASLLVVENFG